MYGCARHVATSRMAKTPASKRSNTKNVAHFELSTAAYRCARGESAVSALRCGFRPTFQSCCQSKIRSPSVADHTPKSKRGKRKAASYASAATTQSGARLTRLNPSAAGLEGLGGRR